MRGQWTGFEQILTEEKPDVLLVSGGVLPITSREAIDEKLEEILFLDAHRLFWRRDVDAQKRTDYFDKYAEFVYKLGIVRFYSALQYACRRCKVFTVQCRDYEYKETHHDANIYPFFTMPAYDSRRIDAIENCKEVSGKIAEVGGLKILGLGGPEFRFKKKLEQILTDAESNAPDLIFASISSERGKRIPRVKWICSRLRPKLFIYGWYGSFQPWLTGDTWVVEAGYFPHDYVVISMNQNRVDEIAVKCSSSDAGEYEKKNLYGW